MISEEEDMRILIVDDEGLAREVLKSQLEKFGYSDIIEASNAYRALEVMKLQQPDLIFVDICMPEMSGIQLMEQAKKMGSKFIYVILSGHDRFEYAQRTMELGAYNYLLKPVADDRLKEVMETAQVRLNLLKKEREKFGLLNRSVTKKQQLLVKQYIYELVSGDHDPKKFYDDSVKSRPVTFKKTNFEVSLLRLKTYPESKAKEDQEITRFSIENIIEEIVGEYDIDAYFFCRGKYIGVILNYDPQKDMPNGIIKQEVYRAIFDKVQEFVNFLKKSKLTIGVGGMAGGIEQLQEAYSSAEVTVNQRLVRGGGTIYFEAQDQNVGTKTKQSSVGLEEKIIKSLYHNEEKNITRYLEEFYAPYLHAEHIDTKKLHKQHLNLFIKLHQELEKQGISSSDFLEDELMLYHKIQVLDSIEEMRQFLFDRILLCMKAMNEQGGVENEKIIIRAKEFIDANLGNNLTLERVAEYVNFSSVYFSRFFKSVEGINFIDYVTRARINKAKELLQKNIKTAEICDQIGFQDIKHFYKTFKKIVGVTPGQYKKSGIS